jgi:non-ribosomal peptide synthetase component F
MRRRMTRREALAVGAAALSIALPSAAGAAVGSGLPRFVRPRGDWDAAPPGDGMRRHAIERVTLHHTGPPAWHGSPAAPAYLRAIQAFHTGPERGWPDIAYHLLIDLDGVVWEGRPLAVAGDTATVYDPAGHALIAVLGDYDEQTPNEAQRDAVTQAVAWLLDAHGLGPASVGGHRDYAATACPGRALRSWLPALRASLA